MRHHIGGGGGGRRAIRLFFKEKNFLGDNTPLNENMRREEKNERDWRGQKGKAQFGPKNGRNCAFCAFFFTSTLARTIGQSKP